MPLVEGRYAPTAEEWLLGGKASSVRRESLRRRDVVTDIAAALVTQIMTSVAVPVQAGDTITNITFLSGATQAGTPTNYWFALYDDAGALLSQTADQLTAAWAADTAKTLALATAQTFSTPKVVFAACMVKATTVPSLVGVSLARAAVSGGILSSPAQVALARNSGSALTTTAPATIASPTNQAGVPYCILS